MELSRAVLERPESIHKGEPDFSLKITGLSWAQLSGQEWFYIGANQQSPALGTQQMFAEWSLASQGCNRFERVKDGPRWLAIPQLRVYQSWTGLSHPRAHLLGSWWPKTSLFILYNPTLCAESTHIPDSCSKDICSRWLNLLEWSWMRSVILKKQPDWISKSCFKMSIRGEPLQGNKSGCSTCLSCRCLWSSLQAL